MEPITKHDEVYIYKYFKKGRSLFIVQSEKPHLHQTEISAPGFIEKLKSHFILPA